jgi:pSer/pThr/pTyr-binding forkhead associated (FHA) protein
MARILIHQRGENQRSYLLTQDVTKIGRAADCHITISSPYVSRYHAEIRIDHNHYVLLENKSANGTSVNGKQLDNSHQLRDGDQFCLGTNEVTLIFADPDDTQDPPPEEIQLLIHTDKRSVEVYGVSARLSPLEYNLLCFFAATPGVVRTREDAFLAVWGQTYASETCKDAFNACLTKLRRKLHEAAAPSCLPAPTITAAPRFGFCFSGKVVFRHSSDH